MYKIKVKNIGPIKEGLTEGDGFLDITDFTVLIGNQATGKSTLAKLVSTFLWIEKALYRGYFTREHLTKGRDFIDKYCDYQGLKNYFRTDTEIVFMSSNYKFQYSNQSLIITTWPTPNYFSPKIMYVPAERNFLSVVDSPEKIRHLPLPLLTFLEEFERSKKELVKPIELPIGGIKFEYNSDRNSSSILGKDYKILLKEASSGLQSVTPLYLVSQNLTSSNRIELSDKVKLGLSLEQDQQLKDEIREIYDNPNLSDEFKRSAVEALSSKYRNMCFVNIVEEIEQNLFPKSQKELLFSLIRFVNNNQGNKLFLTTHSPYIINYISLAMKAGNLLERVKDFKFEDQYESFLYDVFDVVPQHSSIIDKGVSIYEMSENGTIAKLDNYAGIPSDENYLNASLGEINGLYDKLLEIEESYESKLL